MGGMGCDERKEGKENGRRRWEGRQGVSREVISCHFMDAGNVLAFAVLDFKLYSTIYTST